MTTSESNAGAFVSLLNAEMEGLINSSTYNFGRMLFGDGRGLLAKMSISPVDDNGYIKVDTTASLVEGQKIVLCDFMDQLIDTDEIKIVEVLKEYAEFESYSVDSAINGMEAIQKCKENLPLV